MSSPETALAIRARNEMTDEDVDALHESFLAGVIGAEEGDSNALDTLFEITVVNTLAERIRPIIERANAAVQSDVKDEVARLVAGATLK